MINLIFLLLIFSFNRSDSKKDDKVNIPNHIMGKKTEDRKTLIVKKDGHFCGTMK